MRGWTEVHVYQGSCSDPLWPVPSLGPGLEGLPELKPILPIRLFFKDWTSICFKLLKNWPWLIFFRHLPNATPAPTGYSYPQQGHPVPQQSGDRHNQFFRTTYSPAVTEGYKSLPDLHTAPSYKGYNPPPGHNIYKEDFYNKPAPVYVPPSTPDFTPGYQVC